MLGYWTVMKIDKTQRSSKCMYCHATARYSMALYAEENYCS